MTPLEELRSILGPRHRELLKDVIENCGAPFRDAQRLREKLIDLLCSDQSHRQAEKLKAVLSAANERAHAYKNYAVTRDDVLKPLLSRLGLEEGISKAKVDSVIAHLDAGSQHFSFSLGTPEAVNVEREPYLEQQPAPSLALREE
jgi:hypothetical protein